MLLLHLMSSPFKFTTYMKMGLKFALVPTKIPLQDAIASVEDAARQPKDDADDVRGHVCGILNTWLPNDNMKKDHWEALKELINL